ncbi:MAG: pilus assembly protein PilM [Patescibacteria group bacterium]
MPYKAAGIDISDRSIEVVAFRPKGAGIIDGVVRAELPAGIITRGEIQNYDELLAQVNRLFDILFGQHRGKIPVGLSLPETSVYSQVFRLPVGLETEQYKKALEINASEEFPYDSSIEMSANFVSIKSDNEARYFWYSTVDAHLVNEYERLLNDAGLEPLFMEPESAALARAVLAGEDSADTLLADIGARTTMLVALGERGEAVLSSAVPVGGEMLTSAVEERLGLSMEDAEAAKRKGGFDPTIDDGRVMMILQHPFDDISNEIRTTINFYEKKTSRNIKKIVLAGGTSLLPSVTDYVSSRFTDLVVERGEPLKRFGVTADAVLPPNFKNEAILYSTAIGLSIRASGSRDRPGPNLLPSARNHGHGRGRVLNFIRSIFKKSPRPMSPTKASSSKKKASPKKKSTRTTAKKSTQSSDGPAAPAPVMRQDLAPAAAAVERRDEEQLLKSEAKTEAMTTLGKIVDAEDSAVVDESVIVERDFGMGVGDILSNKLDGKTPAEAGSVESDSAEKLSIETILQGHNSVDMDSDDDDEDDDDEHDEDLSDDGTPAKRRLRWSVFIPLIVFILAVLLLAQGVGLFGGNGQSSTTKFLSSLTSFFGGSDTEQPAVTDEPQPNIPAVVSLNVMITSEDEAGEDIAVPVIKSRLIETDVQSTDSFPATGEAPAGESRAVGTITVVNETSNDYKFVATTRFLTAEGVLFRLKNPATIPPNDTVDVEVYADLVGAVGDIGPSRFTIPGLPTDVQQYVYGRSRSQMTGGSGTVVAVAENDLEEARRTLLDRLLDEANENFKSMISAEELVLNDLIVSSELDATLPEEGQAGSTFEATLSVRFGTLVVPEAELLALLAQKMAEELPAEAVAADYELGTPLHTVEAFDTTSGRAEIRIEAPIQLIR